MAAYRVRNLWKRVTALETIPSETRKIVDHQGGELEAIRAEVADLRRQVRGLKIGRGLALAKNARLRQQVAEAEKILSDAERRLH